MKTFHWMGLVVSYKSICYNFEVNSKVVEKEMKDKVLTH